MVCIAITKYWFCKVVLHVCGRIPDVVAGDVVVDGVPGDTIEGVDAVVIRAEVVEYKPVVTTKQ